MADTIRVRAVPGRVYGDPRRPGEFVGLRRVTGKETPSDAHHVVPNGFAYVSSGAVEVPNTREIRRALRCGDLKLAPEEKTTKAAKRGGSEY